MEDDITHKSVDIVRGNNRIKKNRETVSDNTIKYKSDYENILQHHVYTYIDNESLVLAKSEQKSRATKSIVSRLKGKEGIVRGNLMGKRVDFYQDQ